MEIQLSVSAKKSLAEIVDALIGGSKLAAPLLPTIRRLNDLAIGPVADIKAAGFPSKKAAQEKLNKLTGLLNANGKTKKPAFKPKVNTGDPKRDLATSPSGRQPSGFSAPDGTKAKAKKFSKADVEKIADRLSYKVRFGKGTKMATAIQNAVEEWAGMHSVQYPNQSRLLSKDAVTKALTAIMEKRDATVANGQKATEGKKAPVKAPVDKVVQPTKAATKEEKQKAQILAATKLRNQFQGMLTKAPAMTAKAIENIRKHCDAYNRVITSVQKGNEALAETTKIEGLRGIESVKNYVNNVLGLTYGYVEFAKVMAGTQADFKARVMNRLKPEEMTKVELRRKAKENAQFALMNFTKQLGKRQCRVPPKFTTDMQRIFSTAVESGDFKAAKAEARALFDTLVADVFSNKVKMYSGK
jgi:hypothetical protein